MPEIPLKYADLDRLPCACRFLYAEVGAAYEWTMRLRWSEAEWLAWLDRPQQQTWIGHAGTPAGYFELEAQPEANVELAYFGLLPPFVGKGYGGALLTAAIQRAWDMDASCAWVHTCNLDHPMALRNYQARLPALRHCTHTAPCTGGTLSNSFEKWISGDAIPRRGNWFSRGFANAVLSLLGWKAVGQLPNLPKFLLVGAPHTSNLDGVLAVFVLMAVGLGPALDGQKRGVRQLFGGLLRWLGRRSRRSAKSPQDVVGQIVDRFEKRDQFVVVIAPEGTRKRVERWKTGLSHCVSQGTDCTVYADYAKREVGIGPLMQPSGDLEKDMAEIRAFFSTITPRHPDRA
ncbi:MAG: GNAT family N-acetyltransferase [Caldilineaceae bacterium]